MQGKFVGSPGLSALFRVWNNYMSLHSLLEKKRDAIVGRWIDYIVETYPAETAQFLKNKKDRFANPVGHAVQTETANLFDQLLNGIEPDKASGFLDNIVRIRALQDFSPSQALGFVFALKHVIRRELKGKLSDPKLAEEFWGLENDIDRLALMSFEIYSSCREEIYQLKAKEVHSNAFMLFRQARLLVEEDGPGQEPDEGNGDSQT